MQPKQNIFYFLKSSKETDGWLLLHRNNWSWRIWSGIIKPQKENNCIMRILHSNLISRDPCEEKYLTVLFKEVWRKQE